MKKLTKIVLLVVVLVLSLVLATACETLENHTHAPATEWASDGTNHWHACTFEGCTEQLDKTACSGGTATLTEKAIALFVATSTVKFLSQLWKTTFILPQLNGWQKMANTTCLATLQDVLKKYQQGTCSGGIPTSHNQPTCVACGNKYGQANYYGEHDYDTSYFITDKTIDELYALDPTDDHTTEVYVVQAKVVLIEDAHYTSIKLADPTTGTQLSLYCKSAGQYSWLFDYKGQVVTLELVPCNWNGKTYYAFCAISVTDADGNKIINTLNFGE